MKFKLLIVIQLCVGLAIMSPAQTVLLVGPGNTSSIAVLATDIGCTMNDSSSGAMTANVAAINAWLDTLKNPYSVTKSVLVIPPGRLYTNDQIIVPPKTGILITGVGSGLSYRAGLFNFSYPGQEGPVSTIICRALDATKAALLVQGVGTEICHLKIQGREIPTNDTSGTEQKIGYGIRVESNDFPPTGKHHFHDLTFVDLGTPFYYPASPDTAHGDTADYGKLVVQGCDRIMLNENEQSIGHNFYGTIEFGGDGVSGSQNGFDMYDGGDLHVANLHWNTLGGNVLKLRSGCYSPFNNSYEINVRWDGAAAGSPCNFSLLDATEASNNDYPFHIRFRGSIAGYAGEDYTASNLIKLAAGETKQHLDILQDVQVTYTGADATARNAQRALHSAFNAFRSPATPYHDNE